MIGMTGTIGMIGMIGTIVRRAVTLAPSRGETV